MRSFATLYLAFALVLTSLLTGCGERYDVVITLAGITDYSGIEVALVSSCADQPRDGSSTVGPRSAVLVTEGGAAELGTVPAGTYGLLARAWDVDCHVIGWGCTTTVLEDDGVGVLSVEVAPLDGGCTASIACTPGRSCATRDGGLP